MAQNSKSIVYGGNNRGQATILDSPSITDIIALKQKKAQDKAELEQKKKEADLKVAEYSPEDIWNVHSESQQREVNGFYDKASKYYSGYDQMSDEEKRLGRLELNRMKTSIDQLTAKANNYKVNEDKFREEAKSNPHRIYGEVDKLLKQSMIDVDGNTIPITDLNEANMTLVNDDPSTYNGPLIISDFKKSLSDSSSSFWETNGGYDEQTTIKTDLFKFDDNGQLFNESGEPLLNITPKTLNLAKKDSDMALQIQFEKKRIMEDEGRSDVTDMEAFTNLLEPTAYSEIKKQKKANQYSIEKKKAEYRANAGKPPTDVFDLYYKDLATTIETPIIDENATPKYSIQNGIITEGTNGSIMLPVHSQLSGMVIGEETNNLGKKSSITINEIITDPNTNKTYYNTSNNSEFKLLDNYTANDLNQQILGQKENGMDYTEAVAYGTKNNILSRTPEGVTYFNSSIKQSDRIEQQKKANKDLQETTTNAINTFKTTMNSVIETTKSSEGTFMGYNKGYVEKINEQLGEIPENSVIEVGGEKSVNPKIRVVNTNPNGLFQTESDFKIEIDGRITETVANQENFKLILDSLKPNLKMSAKVKNSEEDFDSKWAKLKSGESLVGPDGITYTKQ